MKRYTYPVAILCTFAMQVAVCTTILCACVPFRTSEEPRHYEPDSWHLYCKAYHVDPDAPTPEQENTYLDCWCGSVEEEFALDTAR